MISSCIPAEFPSRCQRVAALASVCGALVLAIGVMAAPARASDQWGDLKGRFVYDGQPPVAEEIAVNQDLQVCKRTKKFDESLVVGEDGGIRYIVVYLKTKISKVQADYVSDAKKEIQLDITDCRFEPHILPIMLTQTLKIRNKDPISHNANWSPIGDRHASSSPLSGLAESFRFSRVQNVPVPVACNIHPWMKGYVIPRDNPYVAVSDADGAFEIKNLPVGTHEFRTWHERSGYVEAKSDWKRGIFKFEIKEGQNDLGEIKVDPKLFEAKR